VFDPSSNISRWVTFLFGPLLLVAGAFVAAKAKQWFNYDLDPAAATAYFVGIVGGLAALVVTWLRNRGKYEIAKTTGISPETLDLIATAIANRLPAAPTPPTAAGDALTPRTPPPAGSPGPGGMSPGQ
jgi:hypothetical protein